jgi:hypothetical protein
LTRSRRDKLMMNTSRLLRIVRRSRIDSNADVVMSQTRSVDERTVLTIIDVPMILFVVRVTVFENPCPCLTVSDRLILRLRHTRRDPINLVTGLSIKFY